jgi:hypothetical protein
MRTRFFFVIAALTATVVLGCPLGRKNNELGGECSSANDCPMGTTGLFCASPCSGPKCPDKSFCTKDCKADADCVSKVGAMVCTQGKCAFAGTK